VTGEFVGIGAFLHANTPHAEEVEHGVAGIVARDAIDFIGD
jgi:hypothetical protein